MESSNQQMSIAEKSPSSSSSSSSKQKKTVEMERGVFDVLTEDLLLKILSKLPALSFASAACVSRSWNVVCRRVLSRPKLASALSRNPFLPAAVVEVVDKVLSEPIRPHFVLACVAPRFCVKRVHQLISKRLGSIGPIITCEAGGLIGRDALTDMFMEVRWGMDDEFDGSDAESYNSSPNVNQGIGLTVGCFPGLRVDAIPLLWPKKVVMLNSYPFSTRKAPQKLMVDEFVRDIKDYTVSVSGCTSPKAITLFSDLRVDMRHVLDSLDGAFSVDTVVVGDPASIFSYRSVDESRNVSGSLEYCSHAVALIFARDINKSHDIGEIDFHLELSTGLSPIGASYKAAAVKNCSKHSTWLTARKEGLNEILDGQRILDDLYDEMGNRVDCPDLYIGVTKRRKYIVGPKNARWITSLAFHEVLGGDEAYLFVNGVGIRTGDAFQFYHSDPIAALSSCRNVSLNLRNYVQAAVDNGEKKEVFGGLIFTCFGRCKSFFGCSNFDSSPFLENFPGVPVAGQILGGEIGRCSTAIWGENREPASCSLHFYSSVYLLMAYTPPTMQH